MGTRRCLVFAFVLAAGCSHKHVNPNGIDAPGGGDGPNGDADLVDAMPGCSMNGKSCTTGATCCSGFCEQSMHLCSNPLCHTTGFNCMTGADCCSNSCIGNLCQATCTSDNLACTSNGQCCSGTCGANNTCTPLNTTCLTAGNACPGALPCCSGNCNAGGTCGPSSYCTQNGDICSKDLQCCGGLCTIAAGATVGTCTQPMTGQTDCSVVDGALCTDCTGCCSRLCEVYPPTGTKICQPAEGCVVDGDICFSTANCCGAPGTGLPGAGNVRCVKQSSTDPVGVCRNPMSCNPEGNVCHYLNYTCSGSSARADCCMGLGAMSAVCKLDALGIPRCYGLAACVMVGGNCSNSSDCCNGVPCVPNSMGQLVCYDQQCIGAMSGQQCTQTSDCCSGLTCVYQPGSLYGTCGGTTGTCVNQGQTCNTTNLMCCSTAGACTDTTTQMACTAASTSCTCGGGTTCALQGQTCNATTLPCCTNNGNCTDLSNGMACTSTSASCSCQIPIF